MYDIKWMFVAYFKVMSVTIMVFCVCVSQSLFIFYSIVVEMFYEQET